MIGINQKVVFKKRFKGFRERKSYFKRLYIVKKEKKAHIPLEDILKKEI